MFVHKLSKPLFVSTRSFHLHHSLTPLHHTLPPLLLSPTAMGILYFSEFAKSKKVTPVAYTLLGLLTAMPRIKLGIDAKGNFFVELRDAAAKNNPDIFVNMVRRYFPLDKVPGLKKRLRIVFDGKPSQEKANTHRQRRKTGEAAAEKLKAALDVLQPSAKISKSKWDHLDKLASGLVVITPDFVEKVVERLKAAGYDAVIAPYEADVELTKLGPDWVVVTRDSDAFFHKGIQYNAVANHHKGELCFSLYKRSDVLKTLDLTQGML